MKSKFNLKLNLSHEKSLSIESFIENHGTVFQKFDFLNAVGSEYCCISAINEQTNDIVGVLPLVKMSKFYLKAYHIPAYTYQFGPIISSEFQKYKPEILSVLLNDLPKSSHYDFKIFMDDEDVIPFKKNGFTVTANQTHIIPKNENYSIKNIHSSKVRYLKKLLKKLENGELFIKENFECQNDLLFLQEETARKSNFASHINNLKLIVNSLTTKDFYSLVVYDSNGKPLAGAFCPFDINSAYHLINASVTSQDNLLGKANFLSTYLAITKAKEKGLAFDFEGSNVMGVANYYRSMGGVPKLIYRTQKTKSFYYQLLRLGETIRRENK